MTDHMLDYYNEHQKAFNAVYGQIKHLGYKNWDCGCKRNAATAVMTRNYPHEDDRVVGYEKVPLSRAIAVGASYSDPIRVATMLADDKPWDEVIIVGDREGPLYDQQNAGILHVKTPSELPSIESFDPKKRTLVIFDECFTPKGDLRVMYDFSIRSRLRGVYTLFVECDLLHIPKFVRRNTDVLYLTTDPRPHGWKEIKRMLCADAPIAKCFAALSRPKSWFKVDMRNNETEVIDASKYYP